MTAIELPAAEPGSPLARLLAKVQPNPETGCWIWTGAFSGETPKFAPRYGVSRSAMRVAYELLVGPTPTEHHLRRSCGDLRCVNPDHATTRPQGRQPRPKTPKPRAHCGKKLTPEKVAAIRADGRLHREIAIEYGISKPTVSQVKSGRIWPSLPAAAE
ncbi:hypothetical protein [Azospirillum argentinense]|uniref:hypothetical protein n=1 Tax=Azospirillum argentinense TaxID=2970906 RepID=UPI0032E00701